jgi:branched-chain amino acid aminotransferase
MAFVPFDDRDGWIWMNGDFVPWREAKTHVLTHALHYGSSVFEGERMYAGEIFKLTEHTERLHRSANLLDFEIPFTVAEIDEACKATCARMGLDDCYVRPVAFRGPEQVSVSAFRNKTHVAIAVWDWPSYFDPETKRKGIRIEWAKWRRLPRPRRGSGAGRCRRPECCRSGRAGPTGRCDRRGCLPAGWRRGHCPRPWRRGPGAWRRSRPWTRPGR